LHDIQDGLGVLREAEEIDPPPVLVNRILFQIPAKESGLRGWLGRMFEPVRQPRFVMGAMMTVLSLAMMSRCAGVPNRTLTQTDVDPVKIFGAFEDRVHRTWDRGVMAYESIRLVYEIRSRVHDWRTQQEELDSATSEAAIKAREVPASSAGNGKAAPATSKAPSSVPPAASQTGSGNKEVGK
jgi:hypothetical protein